MTLYELYIAAYNLRKAIPGIDLEVKRNRLLLMRKTKESLDVLLKNKELYYLSHISFLFISEDTLTLITEFMALYELVNNIDETVSPMFINQLEACLKQPYYP